MAADQQPGSTRLRTIWTAIVIVGALTSFILFALYHGRTRPAGSSAPVIAAFSYDHQVGWIQGPCLAINSPGLAVGTPVAVIVMGKPQKIRQAKIQEHTTSPVICKALLEDRAATNAKPETTFYKLDVTGIDATDMGFGIVNPPANLSIADDLVQVDLDQDGRNEVFSSCATTDGIKFEIWTGKANQGQPHWSAYNYMGYDMKPTCP